MRRTASVFLSSTLILAALAASFGFTPGVPEARAAMPTDAVFALDLDGSVANTGSNGDSVTVSGTAQYGADKDGAAGKALSFNGSTYLDVSSGVAPASGILPFTYATWFKAPGSFGSTQYIFGHGYGANSKGLDIRINPDGILSAQLLIGNDAQRAETNTSSTLTANTWYHLIWTWDGTTNAGSAKLYLSTAASEQTTSPLAQHQPGSTTAAPATYPLRIGRQAGNGSNYFTGSLDSIRVFPRVLTADERHALWAGTIPPIPTDGLFAYYPMNGNANDASGNNRNALTTFGVASTTDRTGATAGAMQLDGVDDYIKLPHPGALGAGAISTWARFEPSTADQQILLSVGTDGGGDWMFLGVHRGIDGNLRFGFWDSGWKWASAGSLPTTTTWHHITTMWGPGGLKLYIDGSLLGTNPYAGGIPATSNAMYLGRDPQGNFTKAALDDLRIYSRELTAGEVQALYLGINPNTPPTADPKSVTTVESTPISTFLTGSDPDAGQALSFALEGQPTHGTATLSPTTGELQYTPAVGFVGTDSLTFTVSDGTALSPPATVGITVDAAPTTPPSSGSGTSTSPWTESAGDLSYTAGQVAIGAAGVPAGFTLAVAGKILTEGVSVKLASAWPDFVFAPDFAVKSLAEIRDFVAMNRHLPGVPSEVDVAGGSVELGALTQALLQKVEEIFLQLFRLDDRVTELEADVATLRAENALLREDLSELRETVRRLAR